MKKLLVITADTNDADYVTSQHEIKEDDLLRFKKILSVVKKERHNWEIGEYGDQHKHPSVLYRDQLSEGDIEWFGDLLPYGEYGIHSIVNVQLLEVASEESLLKI